jgi:hypothetical protein
MDNTMPYFRPFLSCEHGTHGILSQASSYKSKFSPLGFNELSFGGCALHFSIKSTIGMMQVFVILS